MLLFMSIPSFGQLGQMTFPFYIGATIMEVKIEMKAQKESNFRMEDQTKPDGPPILVFVDGENAYSLVYIFNGENNTCKIAMFYPHNSIEESEACDAFDKIATRSESGKKNWIMKQGQIYILICYTKKDNEELGYYFAVEFPKK